MMLARHDDTCAGLQVLPHTFAGLMDLYERNYISMRRLIPVMPPVQTHVMSQVPGGLSLHLEVIKGYRYTTELFLTYKFLRDQGVVAEPNLRLRIYHDARLAEVMAVHFRRWPQFQAGEEGVKQSSLECRWRVNRFLYKWLNYCWYQGHRF